MKKLVIKILLFTVLILILNPFSKYTYCIENNQETLKEQQEEFQIQEFINDSKEYGGEFFEGINIEDILNDAIKRWNW